MNANLQALYDQLSAANREVDRIERLIGDFQRACRHERDPRDPNYCLWCEKRLPAENKSD